MHHTPQARPNYYLTGNHSEAVQIEFDPRAASFAQLLELFWWPCYTSTQITHRRQAAPQPDIRVQNQEPLVHLVPQQRPAGRRHSLAGSPTTGGASVRVKCVLPECVQRRYGARSELIGTRVEAAGAFHRAELWHQQYLSH